jgi:hypothetical protein
MTALTQETDIPGDHAATALNEFEQKRQLIRTSNSAKSAKRAPHFLNPLTTDADLTRASARMPDREHEAPVAFATHTFLASCAVPDGALQPRAAQPTLS